MPIALALLGIALAGGVALAYFQEQKAPSSPGARPAQPSVPSSPPAPAGPTLVFAPPSPSVVVQNGRQYLAKVVLTGLESAFGDAGAVRDKLTKLGFSAVFVWKADPPVYFPDRGAASSGSTYWAQGFWQKDTATIERPEQIAMLWLNTGDPIQPGTQGWTSPTASGMRSGGPWA